MYHYRVRLKWAEMNLALARLDDQAAGGFHATQLGNDPAIECESGIDAVMLLEAFPEGALDYV